MIYGSRFSCSALQVNSSNFSLPLDFIQLLLIISVLALFLVNYHFVQKSNRPTNDTIKKKSRLWGILGCSRFWILPIYYNFLKVLFADLLTQAIWTVIITWLHAIPTYVDFTVAALLNGIESALRVGVAIFMLQESSGKEQIVQATKDSFIWGAIVSAAFILANAFAYQNGPVLLKITSAINITRDILLLIFYTYILLARFHSAFQCGNRLKPRAAVVPYCLYQIVILIIVLIGYIIVFFTDHGISNCVIFVWVVCEQICYVIWVFITFYRDSLQWRVIPGLTKSFHYINKDNKNPTEIDESVALLEGKFVESKQWKMIDFARIRLIKKLASGATAEVHKAMLDEVKEVAVKIYTCEILTEEVVHSFVKEAFLMSQLNHINIVQYEGICIQPPDVSLVMEYCERGSIYTVLHVAREKLTWKQRMKLAIGSARGVAYLHRKKIIHRDIKSLNCLVDSSWNVKVADFGQSREWSGSMTYNRGTLQWCAPEVLAQRTYSEKADVYSFGILLWELYTAEVPYFGWGIVQMLNAVVKDGSRPTIPIECPYDYAELIRNCWDQNPSNRPDIQSALKTLEAIYQDQVKEKFNSYNSFSEIILPRRESSSSSAERELPIMEANENNYISIRGFNQFRSIRTDTDKNIN